MGTKKSMYLVQHAGAAFMSNSDVPEGQWKTLSRHSSRQQAASKISTLVREDRRYNGRGCWSDMYRIVKA